MCQEEELLKLDLKIANSGYGDDAWLLCSLLRNWSGTDKLINSGKVRNRPVWCVQTLSLR